MSFEGEQAALIDLLADGSSTALFICASKTTPTFGLPNPIEREAEQGRDTLDRSEPLS